MLAGIGLYGVIDYSVVQRRRELGIRIAVGASTGDIARRVTMGIFSVVLLGTIVGIGVGFVLQPYVKSLLYEVTPFDLRALAIPSLTIALAVLLAAMPGVIRALRIDPAQMLRSE